MAIAVQCQGAPFRTVAATRGAAQDQVARTTIVLYFLGLILPSELAINLFGFALFPIRLVLVLLFIPAVLKLLNTRDVRLQAFDYFLALGLAWLVLALIVNNGPEKGLKYGGALVLEALGGYILARAYVRNYAQFAFVVWTYFVLVLVVAAIAIPETFFGIKLIHPLASSLFGAPPIPVMGEPGRLGLERAMSTFDHPILYGAFCSTSLGLVFYAYYGQQKRWIMAAAIVFATFCAVSTAPLLACAMAAAFICCERWSRHIHHRVAIMALLATTGYAILAVSTNRTVVEVVVSFIALDPWTAYYRTLIWQFASENIANNPLFGIGLNTWARPGWMTGSVDSFWLVTALTGGLPTITLVVLAVLLPLWRVHVLLRELAHRGLTETPERWKARMGWTVAVLALSLQAFTVHYWDTLNSLFFFILGLGTWMTDSLAGLKPTEKSPVAKRRPRALERRSALSPSGPLVVPRSHSVSAKRL
jgi:hypothetical protein